MLKICLFYGHRHVVRVREKSLFGLKLIILARSFLGQCLTSSVCAGPRVYVAGWAHMVLTPYQVFFSTALVFYYIRLHYLSLQKILAVKILYLGACSLLHSLCMEDHKGHGNCNKAFIYEKLIVHLKTRINKLVYKSINPLIKFINTEITKRIYK